jgi:hypothetical protein
MFRVTWHSFLVPCPKETKRFEGVVFQGHGGWTSLLKLVRKTSNSVQGAYMKVSVLLHTGTLITSQAVSLETTP